MPETNKRQVLKKQIQEQGLNVAGQSFPQQMTAFYEGRISTALAAKDAGEKYLALNNIHEEIQSYIEQNNLVVEKRKESKIAEGITRINFKRAAYATGTVMLIAAAAAFMAPAGILTLVATGVAGVAGIFTVAEAATAFGKKSSGKDAFQDLATAENNALTSLSGKVEKELTSLAEQTPAQAFLQSVKASALVTLTALKSKLQNAFKGVTGKKSPNDNKAPNANPTEIKP